MSASWSSNGESKEISYVTLFLIGVVNLGDFSNFADISNAGDTVAEF